MSALIFSGVLVDGPIVHTILVLLGLDSLFISINDLTPSSLWAVPFFDAASRVVGFNSLQQFLVYAWEAIDYEVPARN